VQLYPANGPGGTPNQQWKFIPVTIQLLGLAQVQLGFLIASALDNNLVLDVRGGGGAAHTPLQIFSVGNNQANQIWNFTLLS
jgi:hypothetical protein